MAHSVNYVGAGSLIIRRAGGLDIDVYEELHRTSHTPIVRLLSQSNISTIEFGDEVFNLIYKFVRSDGYAGLSLAEYLDGLFISTPLP